MMKDPYGSRSLREIARIPFRHWFLLSFMVALGGVGTYMVCEYYAPRQYRSSVGLIFQPQDKNPMSADGGGERAIEVFVKAQQQIVMSDLVLARAKVISEDESLREKWYCLRESGPSAVRDDRAKGAELEAGVVEFLTKGEVQRRVDELLGPMRDDLIRFAQGIKLETPGGEVVGMTGTFSLIVDRPGPRDIPHSHLIARYAADILADMYIFRYQQIQQQLNNPPVGLMDNVIAEYRTEVSRRLNAYQSFVEANAEKVGVLEQLLKSGTEDGVQGVLSKIREDDVTLDMLLARDQAMYGVLKKSLPASALEYGGIARMSDEEVAASLSRVSVDFFRENAAYVEQTKMIATLEGRVTRVETQFMEESRDLRDARHQLSTARRQLLQTIAAHVQGLAGSVAAREEQKRLNEALMVKASNEQKEIHSQLATYARLKNEFEVAQKQLEKLEEEGIAAMSSKRFAKEAVTISKLDAATTPNPDKPVAPLTGVCTAVAVAVSLLLGLALAFMADHYDQTLRTTLEAERYLGIPVLGSITKRGRGLVLAG
ncbi:MAG TPA: hypothetical protein VJZ71_05155 [Phycisphaerae bacterium]|nr:hypothetical protein [Phycisphaerae bacterium]